MAILAESDPTDSLVGVKLTAPLETVVGRLKHWSEPRFAAPGPKEHPLFGSTLEFQPDPRGFLLRMADTYGDVVRFRVLLDAWYLVNDPAIVHEVTVRQAEKFHKPRVNKQLFKPFMGNGLVSSDGEHWKKQHKLVMPAFHKKRIDKYGDVVTDMTQDMLGQWTSGATVDMNEELTTLTLKIIVQCLFGADVSRDADKIRNAMEVVNEALVAYVNLPIPLPRWFPTSGNQRKVRAIQDVEEVLFDIVDERQRTGEDRGDLLSMMIQARDEAGNRMSRQELRDEGMTLFFAGHETASHTMTWIWYLLATHPEVVARAQQELADVVGDRAPRLQDLPQLPYLEMIVKEGLRLYGAAWTFMREPVEDVELCGQWFPKESFIVISPHVLHRRAHIYDNPLEFHPERFSKENERKIPKGGYVPFAAGSRVCIGKTFALIEMRLIIGALLQRVTPELPVGFEPVPQAQISLHPANGMPNIVRESSRRAGGSQTIADASA